MTKLIERQSVFLVRLILLLLLLVSCTNAALAELKSSEARKLITRAAEMELPSKTVRVKHVSQTSPTTAEALAEIETPFRLEQSENEWTVLEVRVAPDRWESIPTIANAAGINSNSGKCNTVELFNRKPDAPEPSFRRARCLLAELLGIQLPSDAVRIKEISTSPLLGASRPSALVTAHIQLEFRFSKPGKGRWQVTEVRSGKRDWLNLENLVTRVNEQKRQGALAELRTIAQALEKFRLDRGFYVTSDRQDALIDHLSPRYLAHVVRIDPWHRPYQYQGDRDHFTLRSDGPDRKQNTADDIVLPSR